jgi:hypothetical protein
MKRAAPLVLMALGAALAVGAARSRKFRYLSDRWNRPAGLTEIELACLRSSFTAAEPVPLLKGRLAATEIRAAAEPTHIHLTVRMKALGGEGGPPGLSDLERTCAAAYRYWRSDLFRRSIPGPKDCPVTIDLILGTKTVYRQISDESGRRGFRDPDV